MRVWRTCPLERGGLAPTLYGMPNQIWYSKSLFFHYGTANLGKPRNTSAIMSLRLLWFA